MTSPIFEKTFDFGVFRTFDTKPSFDCFHVHQVHGIDFSKEGPQIKADGIYGEQSLPWAIITADCLPVLIHGNKGNVFFHAGWRGIVANIHLSSFVGKIEPRFAYIGPHIQRDSFEVSEDFHPNFPNSLNFGKNQVGHLCFNLSAELTRGLQRVYPAITVEVSDICTLKDSRFHSFRLDKTEKRNWNVFTSADLKPYNDKK
ncbi:MAG: hypothetical protein CME71_01395 [Halobacteriovorax sp.]|nr:hypothetical protein [Halobacteriovorax sp.]